MGTDHASVTGIKRATRRTQDLLGYETMLPSGVAWLGADEWSISLRISDINYLSAEQEAQERIIDLRARYLNGFGAGTRIQETVVNRVLNEADVTQLVQKPRRNDGFDDFRDDFNRNVREKLAKTSKNTVTEKYVTLTVQEPDRDKAETSLVRLAHETITQLGAIECSATILNRRERLQVLAHILRPHELFTFTEETFGANKRLSTADFVAPWAVDDRDKAGPLVLHNGSAETFHKVLWVRDYPVWLTDRVISELTEIKCDLTASLHLEPFDQVDGMTLVQRQISELEMQLINEQKKARKRGDDFIPHKLEQADKETKELRAELEQTNQKVFSTVMVIGISGHSRDALDQNVKRAMGVLRKHSVTAEVASYMQLDALTTELPIGVRPIPMRRTLTTAAAAIIVPFTTQELFQPGGVWYGTNAQSSNAIVADRTTNNNGNGFVLGTSGSGKSESAKHEIAQVLLDRPNDDVIIIDPDREYEPVVKAFNGTTIRIDSSSQDRVNPLDVDLDAVDLDGLSPINAKTQRVLTMMDVLVGGNDGLTPGERSIIDRCTGAMYARYAAERGRMPAFPDLRDALRDSGTDEGRRLADALEIYTSGSLSAFSHQTTVDDSNRLVSYDISKLGSELRTFGMLVMLDQIWDRVTRNRANGRRTWIYIDEFHLLFGHPYAAEYFQSLWKRIRKYGGNATGITQNIEELLANKPARLMLANSEFLLLLGQNATDADALCSLLHFSDEQRRAFTNVPAGNGLLKSGTSIIAFDGRIREDSTLHKLFNTDFREQS
ncbi:VirB4-like conjugal transfer ATPase, CD1110 family [Clavibacter michiganensis]|uniref:VirB4-like conjugal transfer ATPase, CD1110 family n=1 Tax=Clavibacter michiganensis TaxID=28447 RepID=UPI00292D1B20|nr:DUF87 domain-containing protein [Clavibacter michiganensis]